MGLQVLVKLPAFLNLLLFFILGKVQHCQSHKHAVPTYFHRLNADGSAMSVTSPNYPLRIKSSNDYLPQLTGRVVFKVEPEVTFNKDKDIVSVTWSGITEASCGDFIGFYCPPTDSVRRYLDYIPVNETGDGYKHGQGSFKVTVYNLRVPCEFRYYKYNGEHAQLAARSNELRFHNGASVPLQGHISLTGIPTEMKIMWTSSSDSPPFVRYGVSTNLKSSAKGVSSTYHAKDLCGFPANSIGFRDPGYIHSVLLTGLEPSTFYYYQFGSKEAFSEIFNFTTAPRPDPDFSFKFLAYGDMGLSIWYGAHDTAALSLEEVRNGARLVLHVGDISYARGWAYIWDQWHALIEPYATLAPYMIGIGNHEQDHLSGGAKDPSGAPGEGFHPKWGNYGDDSGGECGVPMYYRFQMPPNGNGIWWYSFDYGSVHFIMMSTEHNFTRGSRQYQWLERDLATVDRKTTPWLVLTGHRPMYTSQETLFYRDELVAKHLQIELEDLFYKYKVDLTIWGHYHSYERTHPVYRQKTTAGAPTYIIVGTAGFVLEPFPWPCPVPEWSAYHAVHYGYGRVTVANRSALLWEWVRNSDKKVTDSVWIYK